jgi:geranylgeranyl diphosphate synthase type I
VELPETLQQYRPTVEEALQQVLHAAMTPELPLYRMMQYQLGLVDRSGTPEPQIEPTRLYGALCLEAAHSVEAAERAAPAAAAAAAELFYESVRVHEDMQLGAPQRGKRDSVWFIWGPAQAINVGDGLHAMARLAILNLEVGGLAPEQTLSAIRAMDDAALRFYEGQYMELTFQERIDVMETQYLKAAEMRQGALVGGALAVGATVAGANALIVDGLGQFGVRLGLAAQVHEDLAAVWDTSGETGVPPKLLNKSKLFPVVHALEKASLVQKRALGDVYFKRVMEPQDVERIRQVLDEVGAREYGQTKARTLATEALSFLAPLNLPPASLARWEAITNFMIGD